MFENFVLVFMARFNESHAELMNTCLIASLRNFYSPSSRFLVFAKENEIRNLPSKSTVPDESVSISAIISEGFMSVLWDENSLSLVYKPLSWSVVSWSSRAAKISLSDDVGMNPLPEWNV